MSLVTNTKRLLESTGSDEDGARIEYGLLSWRELYDGSIITADRHHSSAGEWVIRGDRRFYTVTVASRPYYLLPQHLTLSFYCFSETTTVGSATTIGPPIERVALEFCVLLS